jgi:hypothetical protein
MARVSPKRRARQRKPIRPPPFLPTAWRACLPDGGDVVIPEKEDVVEFLYELLGGWKDVRLEIWVLFPGGTWRLWNITGGAPGAPTHPPRDGPRPAALPWLPTDAPPGSPAKVAALEERARLRQPLFHPKDRPTNSQIP